MQDPQYKNIIGIDRGKKHIGLAYWNQRSNMVMPIGEVYNDQSLMFSLGEMLGRYHIGTVVIGYPKNHQDSREKIDALCKELLFIDKMLVIEKWDEEYTSVLAGATRGDFAKGPGEDTVAAMHILESYIEEKKINTQS